MKNPEDKIKHMCARLFVNLLIGTFNHFFQILKV